VIPAVAGLMATSKPGPALAISWVFAFVASVLGLLGSVRFDLPAAPSILVTLTGLLIVMSAVLGFTRMGRNDPVANARR